MSAQEIGAMEPGDEEPPPFRIRDADELFAGLRHSELAIRIPVLETVAHQPDVIASYGPCQGVSVVDELLAQLGRPPDVCAPWVLRALLAFPDKRVREACCQIAREADDRALLEPALHWLARQPEVGCRETLRVLLDSTHRLRGTLAAEAVKGLPDLDLAERIAIELWLDGQETTPLNQESRDLWLAALRGPHRVVARQRLQQQGLAVLQCLAQVHEQLAPEERAWLLEWAGACSIEVATPLLGQELQSTDPHRAEPALRVMQAHPEAFASLRDLATPLLSSPSPVVRALAWQLGTLPSMPDWSAILAQEAEPQVRESIARRMARENPQLEHLISLAGDPDWRLRAVAAKGLAALGPSALEAARALCLSDRLDRKAVGAQVLIALDDYLWMEENLLND